MAMNVELFFIQLLTIHTSSFGVYSIHLPIYWRDDFFCVYLDFFPLLYIVGIDLQLTVHVPCTVRKDVLEACMLVSRSYRFFYWAKAV